MAKALRKLSTKNTLMLVAAVSASWAAAHEPVNFGICSVAVWGLQTLAVALLACAALALLIPVCGICAALLQYIWVENRNKGHHS